jgi:predicted RNA-binding Zn-ribbon protein involved in translation (DUF1610 family)
MQKVRSSRTVRLFLVGLAATLGLAVAVPRFGAPAEAQTICVGKQCGACGRSVPMSSQVGQRCPHCGAYWGYRRNKNVGTHYSAPPPPREVTIRYDDKTFDVPVVSSGGTVTVPVRTFERVGASVYWRPGEGITVSRAGRSVVIRLGSRTFQTVGTGSAGASAWPVAPKVRRGTTYVALRPLAEALGYRVGWSSGEVSLRWAEPTPTYQIAAGSPGTAAAGE